MHSLVGREGSRWPRSLGKKVRVQEQGERLSRWQMSAFDDLPACGAAVAAIAARWRAACIEAQGPIGLWYEEQVPRDARGASARELCVGAASVPTIKPRTFACAQVWMVDGNMP